MCIASDSGGSGHSVCTLCTPEFPTTDPRARSHRTHTNRDTHPSNALILRFSVARGRKAPCATRAGGPLRRLGRRPLALAKHALARARRRLRLDRRLVVDRRRLGVRVDGGARLLGQLLEERLGELALLVHLWAPLKGYWIMDYGSRPRGLWVMDYGLQASAQD